MVKGPSAPNAYLSCSEEPAPITLMRTRTSEAFRGNREVTGFAVDRGLRVVSTPSL